MDFATYGAIAAALVVLLLIGWSTRNRNPVFYAAFLISGTANAWFWWEAGSALGVWFAASASATGVIMDVLKVQHQNNPGLIRLVLVWGFRAVSIYAGYSAAHMAMEQSAVASIGNSRDVASIKAELKRVDGELFEQPKAGTEEAISAETEKKLSALYAIKVYDKNGRSAGTLRTVSCDSGYYAKRYADDCASIYSIEKNGEAAGKVARKTGELRKEKKVLESRLSAASGGKVSLPVIKDIAELWYGADWKGATFEQKQELSNDASQVFAVIMALVFESTLLLAGMETHPKNRVFAGEPNRGTIGEPSPEKRGTSGEPSGNQVSEMQQDAIGTVIEFTKKHIIETKEKINTANLETIKKDAASEMWEMTAQKIADLTEITDSKMVEAIAAICRVYEPEGRASQSGIQSALKRSGVSFGMERIKKALVALERSNLFVDAVEDKNGVSYKWRSSAAVANDLGICSTRNVASLFG